MRSGPQVRKERRKYILSTRNVSKCVYVYPVPNKEETVMDIEFRLLRSTHAEGNISININFNASSGWLASWKRAHSLSSRRITKFVATVRHKQRDELEEKANVFVEHINQEITLYTPAEVFNADQSGFQSEIIQMPGLDSKSYALFENVGVG
uniref:Uncharacterized protein n=1 Tax=Caenorhabditis japonica TaxID=281687 RepID=A0A8R1E8R8_CAEJA